MKETQWKARSEAIMRLYSVLIEGAERLDSITASLPKLAVVDSPITWQRCTKAFENQAARLSKSQRDAAQAELRVLAELLFPPKEETKFAGQLDDINEDKKVESQL
jgi:hypothetical protein